VIDNARTVAWCQQGEGGSRHPCWPLITPGRAYRLCCNPDADHDRSPAMPDATDYSDAGLLLAAINNEGAAGNCNTQGVYQLSDAYRDKGEEWQQAADFLHLVARFMETWPHPEFSSDGEELRPTCHPVVTFGKVWWRLKMEWPVQNVVPARWLCAMRSREVDGKHHAELRWLTHDGKLTREEPRLLEAVLDQRQKWAACLRGGPHPGNTTHPTQERGEPEEEPEELTSFQYDPTGGFSRRDVEEIEQGNADPQREWVGEI
jgi:hypothetical protein